MHYCDPHPLANWRNKILTSLIILGDTELLVQVKP